MSRSAAASTALPQRAKGNPIAVIYPTDGAVAVGRALRRHQGLEEPECRQALSRLMLSAEYSKVVAGTSSSHCVPTCRPRPVPSRSPRSR